MFIKDLNELHHYRYEVAIGAKNRMDPRLLETGINDRLKMVYDFDMHVTFLVTSLRYDSPLLFSEYAIWTQHLLLSAGGNANNFSACLRAIDSELQECGVDEWSMRARNFISVAVSALANPAQSPSSFFTSENPHMKLAEDFLHACLEMRRPQALKIIHEAITKGVQTQDLYTNVITPALHELGRLWHKNEVSVAQEHYCTAVVQMVMAQLFPNIFGDDPKVGKLVSTCIAGELHEVGARMLTDLFEMGGWDTIYLGADVPNESVIDVLIQQDADILAISATIGVRLIGLAELISAVRQTPACTEIKIMVGGAAFEADNTLWQKLGADGWASNPDDALKLAANWIKQ